MFRRLAVLISVCGTIFAVPTLRLTNTVVYTQVDAGANAPDQFLDAYNIGDGSLSPVASVPPAITWLKVSTGPAQQCSPDGHARSCVPLQFTLRTASLGRGTYTAEVTIADPVAIDAPQVVTVTVQVGASAPLVVDSWLAPGQFSNTSPITFCGSFVRDCPIVNISADDGGGWLSLAQIGGGTLGSPRSYAIHLAPPANMAPGTYHGSVSIDAGETIPVTMRVTTLPIAVPSISQLSVRLAQGGPAITYPFLPIIALSNAGLGTLKIESVAAAGPGVGAYQYADLAIVTIDPGSRQPGTYSGGSITIRCNAANCPVQVPVTFEIVPQGPPLIFYRGVLDNAAFIPGDTVAQGDVTIVKGEQLSSSVPAIAAPPLPTSLGGARVLVNGVAAPLFYSSSGQIAFQMPSNTAVGTALVQIQRDGQASNTVTVDVARRAPRIVVVTGTDYTLRDATHPAKAGETLVLWAIGLGPTTPSVPDGAPAPLNPLAVVTETPAVTFISTDVRQAAPIFAGLSPGGAGLYQVNVELPADLPKGLVNVRLSDSNVASITVQ